MKARIGIIVLTTMFSWGSVHAELSERVAAVLNSSPTKVRATWEIYFEATTSPKVPRVEKSEIDSMWKQLKSYADAMWELEKTLAPGQSISDYPGILAHGGVRWNADKKTYSIMLGLSPYSPADGLGEFSVSFDLAGKILAVKKMAYNW